MSITMQYEIAEIAKLDKVVEAALALQPYLDRLQCFASTCEEYEPNRLVRDLNRALAPFRSK